MQFNIFPSKKLVADLLSDILLSFSLKTNFDTICSMEVGGDSISCIHGLRLFSMIWIIVGHTCLNAVKYSDNIEFRKIIEKQLVYPAIANSTFSVDTFFFITGFLVSFIYLRVNATGKFKKFSDGASEFISGCVKLFGLVGYRFARLTAPYLYVLGVNEIVMKYLASNSVFDPSTRDHINCPKYWWRNMLYINSLYPAEEMCMLWSWYLANDTQCYIIGAIILIVSTKNFKYAAAGLGFLMVSAWTTTGWFLNIISVKLDTVFLKYFRTHRVLEQPHS